MSLLGILKNLLLVFLVMLFAVDFVALTWIFAFSGIGLDKNFYERQLESNDGFALGQQAIAEYGSKIVAKQANGILSEQEAFDGIKQMVSADWLKQQSFGLIENFFGYLKSEKQELELKINLAEPKQKIVEIGTSLIEKKAKENGIAIPAGTSAQKLSEQMASGAGIPDEIDLVQYLGAARTQFEQAREGVKLLYSAMAGMALAGIFLLLIMLGLNLKKIRLAQKWIGISLVLAGLVAFGLAVGANAILGQTMGNEIAKAAGNGVPQPMVQLATGFANAFVEAVSGTAQNIGIGAAAVGFLLLVSGFGLWEKLTEKRKFGKKEMDNGK
ncbi:MAG: hypothetical protein WC602_02600 [archaeon]